MLRAWVGRNEGNEHKWFWTRPEDYSSTLRADFQESTVFGSRKHLLIHDVFVPHAILPERVFSGSPPPRAPIMKGPVQSYVPEVG